MTRAILYTCLILSGVAFGLSSFALWRGFSPTMATLPQDVPPDMTSDLQRLQERLRKLEESPADAETPAKKKIAELKWAKMTADEFLNALRTAQFKEATVFVGSEFKQRYPGEGIYTPLVHAHNAVLNLGFEITDQQIAPDVDETQFKGSLKGKNSADFCLRLVKEKENKWRVSFFSWEYRK